MGRGWQSIACYLILTNFLEIEGGSICFRDLSGILSLGTPGMIRFRFHSEGKDEDADDANEKKNADDVPGCNG